MRYLFFYENEKTKKENRRNAALLLCCFLMIVLCGILMYVPSEADSQLYDSVIRFHVIANSDNETDQKLKLSVRDAVIAEYSDTLNAYESKDEANAELNRLLGEINAFCEDFIKAQGFDYKCSTVIGGEYYNRTEYSTFTMPAGNYTSLRIVIGDGAGKNWWCVLFPPMCTQMATKNVADDDMEQAFIEAGFTGEQYKIITETESPKYRVKFRLLELLFGGGS